MKLLGTVAICAIASAVALSTGGLVAYDLATDSHMLEPKKVRVEFRNYDNTFLWYDDIPYGTDAEYEGVLPTREDGDYYSYTFSSWDKPLNRIKENTIFYAKFTNEPRKFSVTFQNYDKTELYVDRVFYGNTAVYVGPAPIRERDDAYDYRFIGWSGDLTDVREDRTVIAEYEEWPLMYDVTFKNYDGEVLYTDKVSCGGTAVYKGLTPVKVDLKNLKHDYEFVGWDKGLTGITADTTFVAVFEEVETKYKVNFVNYDGELLYVDYVPDGGTAVFYGKTPTKPSDNNYSYIFDGWSKSLTNVENNFTTVAKFLPRERQYYVTFFNGDDSVIYSAGTSYGGTVYYGGAEPTKESDEKYDYYFDDWDRLLTNITQDIDVYPTFYKTLRFYHCTFQNYDGTILYETDVEYGSTAVYFGESPVKPADYAFYKWVGWDKDTRNITGETVFTAQYEPFDDGGGGGMPILPVVVMFYNYDGTLLDGDVVSEGHADYKGVSPTREPSSTKVGYRSFNYVGWDIDVNNVEESYNAFALYETNYGEKIISYRSLSGELLYEDFVYPGNTTAYDGEYYDYLDAYNGFVGWMYPDGTLCDMTNIQESTTLYPKIVK